MMIQNLQWIENEIVMTSILDIPW